MVMVKAVLFFGNGDGNGDGNGEAEVSRLCV